MAEIIEDYSPRFRGKTKVLASLMDRPEGVGREEMERLTGYSSAWMPRLIAKDWRRKLIITGRHYRLVGITASPRVASSPSVKSA